MNKVGCQICNQMFDALQALPKKYEGRNWEFHGKSHVLYLIGNSIIPIDDNEHLQVKHFTNKERSPEEPDGGNLTRVGLLCQVVIRYDLSLGYKEGEAPWQRNKEK
jgi:hypothetical protein